MTERIGQQLGNYHLLRLLGRGGFADVYLGEHVYLHKSAALKVLHIRLGEQETSQFLREARTLARLEHPHIVRVLDFAVQDGLPFLVMDYAPGGSLRTRHPAGTCLPLDTIVSYVSQVASALQYAHDQHLMHRDVKPENMLLDAREQILLADFGLALLTPTHPASTQAMDPALAGTAPYLAPEQVQGKPGPASDQYALGVVVYEWLCGQRPFKGTPIEVALQHVSAPPPSFHEQVPDLSPAVEEVVMRALSKEPELRFPSMQDFATALQHAAYPARDAHIISAVPSASEATGPVIAVQQQVQTQTVTTPGAAAVPAIEREQPDTPGDRPAAAAFWKVPTSLTSLVGREQDVAAACTLLSQPEIRLVTLVGAGGIGKTRLGIKVATRLREQFADGVCFVSLAPISDPDLVPPTITHDLGIQEGTQPFLERAIAFLRGKLFLLVLDNFEQVITAAPFVEDLLVACPHLSVLVTSREVLHLLGEQIFPVPPLAMPDLAHLPMDGDLARYAAVALFVQRARAVMPTFQLTAANARAIAEICVRLDGLPLALELAAARIRLFPPQALRARLAQRFQVLTGGSRTLPERQQTLRNTIQWSYDLLNEQEQRLFRRLAVFVGGWTLEAAEAVWEAGLEPAAALFSPLDGLASLLDKSLVLQVEQEGEPRLIMLETMREYALACLARSRERELTRQAHAQYYLQLAETAAPHLISPEQVTWMEWLEREHNNVRTALEWALEPVEGQGNEQRSDLALRVMVALDAVWYVRGHRSEMWPFLERALAQSAGVATAARARALANAGLQAAIHLGDLDRARALCEESLQLSRQIGDQQCTAHALRHLSAIVSWKGDVMAGRTLAEEALAIYKEVGDRDGVAWSLYYLARKQGEYEKALALCRESLALFRAQGNKYGMLGPLLHLAETLLRNQDQLETVRALAEEGLALSKEIGIEQGVAYSLVLLGQLALQKGDPTTARPLLEKSVALLRELVIPGSLVESLSVLAKVCATQRDDRVARAHYEESVAIAGQIDDKVNMSTSLEGLANVVAAQGELVWAARLWGATEALRERKAIPRPPVDRAGYEQAVATAQAQLGEQAFTAAWQEGRTMTPEQALAAQGPVTMPTTAPAGPSSVPSAAHAPTYPAGLTAREVEILRLVVQGLTDAQVAEQLVISPRTVNWHLTSIYSKLQVSSRAAATRFAIEQHLV